MFTLNPQEDGFISTLDLLLKLIASAGALYLFFVGIKRYLRDQTWRRNEFVATEMKDFTSDLMVRNVMSILDWGSRYVELFPTKANYDDRFAKVDRQILKSALQYHEFKVSDPSKDRFTTTEVAIRDHFDCFLSYFERFEHFIVADLITPAELKPYLQYWIDTISKNIEDDVKNFIFHYIQIYNYKGTQNLFMRFGANVIPQTDIETTKYL